MKNRLSQRVLILDGAMGTQIQTFGLDEKAYRGDRFAHWPTPLKGNNDLLVLTAPQVIDAIHRRYLEAGADIIETNTFNATSVSLADYGMESLADEINRAAVRLARAAAADYTAKEPERPRFVVGSIGPMNKSCSLSPDVNNPALRNVTFDELVDSYGVQIRALVEEGVDGLLIETIFDTLNAKAALYAAMQEPRVRSGEVPIMLSLTLADKGGRTLSGQTLEAFLASVEHAPMLSIGFNCSFGASQMKPFLRQLSERVSCYVSAYPNAGMPNQFGEYDQTAEVMANQVKEYIDEHLVNIIGGCCGTSPEHIAAYDSFVRGAEPRKPKVEQPMLRLSGLELLEVADKPLVEGEVKQLLVVGERCNVAGSRKFLRLIKEENYEEALSIARAQVDSGASILDVNMDDGMLDAQSCMTTFLNYLASEPEISRVPIMIDSSKQEVIEAGLKCLQGKCVVNSISLKEGEEVFLDHARRLKLFGAAVVVMAFDETGQADSYRRKIEICERAYRLLVDRIGFDPTNIIFDPNVLAVATGIEEHNNYAVDFIEATRWIKTNLPGAKVSGGVSNLSFSFRGNNRLREAIHAVFLYHTTRAGMDMAIVNPNESVNVGELSDELLEAIEDLLFNRRTDATERLLEMAVEMKGEASTQATVPVTESMPAEERLEYALMKGITEFLEKDLSVLLDRGLSPLSIIDEVLMRGMNKVGELFGEGKMFLPQVVKTARTMKRAVEILQPHIEREKNRSMAPVRKSVLLATVKGDVHDIGKNIVGVVLACNSYTVHDLGVMVSTEEIVAKTKELKPDFVGLSGLITPSLEEMAKVVRAFEQEGLRTPIVIGGATTSKIHTAVKLAPFYSGVVIYAKDASIAPELLNKWYNRESRPAFEQELAQQYRALVEGMSVKKRLSTEEAYARRLQLDWTNEPIDVPQKRGLQTLTFSIAELVPYINWKFFFSAWKFGARFASVAEHVCCSDCRKSWLSGFADDEREKASEALVLYEDALALLKGLEQEGRLTVTAKTGIFAAGSADDALIFRSEQGKEVCWPMDRQTVLPEEGAFCLSLADYVRPLEEGSPKDYVGGFVVAVSPQWQERFEELRTQQEEFLLLLMQTLADRLAEAGAERLHELVRKEVWGYAPDEELTVRDLFLMNYRGIRPAVGYPSIPRQEMNFVLNELIDMETIGVRLTEHGAMQPSSSVSGLMLAGAKAKYFNIV